MFQLNILLRLALEAEFIQFAGASVNQFAAFDGGIGAAFQIAQAKFKRRVARCGEGDGFHLAAGFACCEHGEIKRIGLVADVFNRAVVLRVFERDAGDFDF